MLYKTIDELLNENTNLHNAVTILIMGHAITKGNGKYLAEWDKLRSLDVEQQVYTGGSAVLTKIEGALLKAISKGDPELIHVLSSAYERIATSQI